MNDLRMGFKQSMLQRMQAPDQRPPPAPGSAWKRSSSSTVTLMQQYQVTDFSIDRILGAPDAKEAAARSRRLGSTQATATASRVHTSADILDLSKGSAAFAAAPSTPSSCTASYASLQQDFFAANASKFYAQLFPHATLHGCQQQASALHSADPRKRYFAPYVLCAAKASTSPAAQPAASNETPRPAASYPRKCSECSVYYQQPPHPAAALCGPVLASAPASYLNTKASAEITFNSSHARPTPASNHPPPPPAATSLISLTAVTNLNFTTNVGKLVKTSPAAAVAVNAEENSYKCRICDKVFGCSETLQAHERTHKSPRYECSDCGKGFSQLRNYKYHLSVHRGTKEFAAECPECGKEFNDKGYLSSHMKIHRNKKEYECPYCPKSFNQRVAFNMHVRIHTGVKPHKCTECGKRFSRKMLLKQHMRTHSGEKPYQCSVCGKSFADRSNMTLHHRLHSGIKPFNCPICPKAFTKKHHLKTHLNYHTGCKPYVCPHPNCNQAFSQSSNMRTHAKKCQYRPLKVMPFPPPLTAMTSLKNVNTSTSDKAFAAPPATTNSSSFTAGIRMLSFGAATALPPAQQQLLSSLRPF